MRSGTCRSAGGRCGCTSIRPEPRQAVDPGRTGCGCGEKPSCVQKPREQGSGCGCGEKASCDKLLAEIRTVDFALYEVILYLDAYPHSCDALETYHKLKEQSAELHAAYESACGPLSPFGNESRTSWDWMKKPFPWEYDGN